MNSLKIYNFIEAYGGKCIELNSAFVSNYNLSKASELQDTDYLLLPLRATKLKVINHMGNFYFKNKDIEYHVHGTGITFTLDEIKYSFEYLPQTNNRNTPIFSISSIYDYMKVVYGYIEQDKFTEVMNELVDKKLITKIDEYGFSFYIPHLELSKNTIQ